MSEELFDKSNNNQIRQNGLIMNTDEVVDLLNSQSKVISAYHYEFVKMRKENERLKEKLNVTALELVDEVISMGKAVEISEMNYHEFLEYRHKKGKPMELQI